MAQPAINPKIEELRFKLKTDPKSRLFYQLAEELRKAGQLDEAEQYLRTGLTGYPTYLAAWVSLGRVLRDQKNDGAAVDALNRALQLDPGNVVAARLLADAYLALGEKVEAIKKYKLVLALLPSDEELRNTIERIDRDLHPVEDAPLFAEAAPEPAAPQEEAFVAPPPPETPAAAEAPEPFDFAGEEGSPIEERAASPAEEETAQPAAFGESPFDRTLPPFEEAERALDEEARVEAETADSEPMSLAHEESPFEEPVSGFTADALSIESPLGISVSAAPLAAEMDAPAVEDLPAADAAPVFDTEPPLPVVEASDAGNTLTMADLYARQGAVEDARHIYENILARDPDNAEVRAKLETIAPRVNPKVAQLERWLAKVSKREVGSV